MPNRTKYILASLVLAVLLVIVYPHPQASHYKYEQGRPWNYPQLIAPFDIPIHPDSVSLQASLDSLNAKFSPVYVRTTVNVDSMMAVAMRRMQSLSVEKDRQPVENASGFYAVLERTLRRAYTEGVMADSLPEDLRVHDSSRIRLRKNPSHNVLQTVSAANIVTVGALMARIDSLAADYRCTRRLQNVGLAALLRPNIVLDAEETRRIFANEKAIVTIDRGVIQRGQTIINKGAIVTAQDYTNLRTYEDMLQKQLEQTQRSDIVIAIGQLLYAALVLAAMLLYLAIFQRKTVWDNSRAVYYLLTLTGVFTVLTALTAGHMYGALALIPLVLVPVLTLLFFPGSLALVTAATAILLSAPVTTNPLQFIVVSYAGAVAAVFSLRRLRQRAQLLRGSVYIIGAYWLAYIAVQLLLNGSFDDFSWREFLCLGINGLLTSLAYILMIVVEKTFGFVSDVTLVELTDTNTPLLRALSDRCPGTFQHSVSVAALAADAARAVGANTLLVRAGAMYHDVGKMENPIFFTENQSGVNPHDGLTPERSAQIIVGHITDGVRIARKSGLPEVLVDFITQHHGRGTAKYFYLTACRAAGDTPVAPGPYTYPGPNPRTVETSILMMADAVEAASRSLKSHTPQAITDLVNRIIDSQIADHLHDDSTLTYRDVTLIKKAFIKRLTTIYHSRVEYPDAPARPAAPAPARPASPASANPA